MSEDGATGSGAGLRELEQATHVLSSIPPVGDFDADPVMAAHGMDLRMRQMAGQSRGPACLWAGYLSSTFVYGDWQGAWVDERCLGPPGHPYCPCTAKRVCQGGSCIMLQHLHLSY